MAVFDNKISVDAALDEAARLEQAGDHQSALHVYEHLHRQEPANLDLKYRAGTAMLRLGRLEDAVPLLRQVVFHAPDNAPARANLGNAHLLLGQLDKAEEAFAAVLELQPDNRNALFGLATIRIKADRHREAAPLTHRLMELLPNNAAALTLAADAGSADPQLDAAIARYRQALRIDPNYCPALLGLGRVLCQRHRLDEALLLALRAIDVQPNKADGYALRGRILLEKEDFRAAKHSLIQALALSPQDVDILVQLSVTARRAGDFACAVEFAERAWAEHSASRPAAKALGAALSALGHAVAAREVLMAGGIRENVSAGTLQLIADIAANAEPLPESSEFAEDGEIPAHFEAEVYEQADEEAGEIFDGEAPDANNGLQGRQTKATEESDWESDSQLSLFRGF